MLVSVTRSSSYSECSTPSLCIWGRLQWAQCWESRTRNRSCWVGITIRRDFHNPRSCRAIYWDPCRSSSRAQLRASTFFGSYEGLNFFEIFWCVRSLADLSLRASFTGDCTLLCRLDISRAESACRVACILLELPSTATCLSRKPASPPHLNLGVIHQCCCHSHYFDTIEMLYKGRPHSTESSFSHPEGNDEDITPVASVFLCLSLFWV